MLTAADRALTGPPQALALSFEEVKDPDCFDTFSGRITVNAVGGAGNYRFKINGGPSQSSPSFDFLKAGNYSVQVFDNLSNSIEIDTVLIDPPLLEIASLDAENPQCFTEGGRVSIIASGGSVASSYEFELSNGTRNTTGVFDGLAEGNYDVVVTDDNGCTDQATLTVYANPSVEDVQLCMGETITLTYTGNPNGVNPFVSSNTGIATVSNMGVVTSISAGTATITFTDDNLDWFNFILCSIICLI